MKNFKEKFASKIQFVKPLYRKVRPKKTTTKHTYVTVDIDNNAKLWGHDEYTDERTTTTNIRPKVERINKVLTNGGKVERKRRIINNYVNNGNVEALSDKTSMFKIALATGRKIEDSDSPHVNYEWLRVYPAPVERSEKFTSILFRYLVCQMGLGIFLALWTSGFVVIINHFEGPYEYKVSQQFSRAQNDLVISLATELRQITPLSPTWRSAIENRIDEERKLTVTAVSEGARNPPAKFWDLAGTFLFSVYVMTALGFGAPVPHTVWGRTASFIYAVVSVPTHIYLMVHLSTCMVVYVERATLRLKSCCRGVKPDIVDKNNLENKTESVSKSGNSELLKSNISFCSKKILKVVNVIFAGHGVPLVTTLYYTLGAVCFGVLRNKDTLEIIMFPLEFTTSGGLDHVEDFVRILYGFYVEGAMILLSCALASLRRYSGSSVNKMAAKYRLFQTEIDLPKIQQQTDSSSVD